MNKIYALIVLIVLSMSTASCGAVSEDVYVRKDVFEVYMQNINTNMERIIQKLDKLEGTVNNLSRSVGELSERIDGVNTSLSGRIDAVNSSLSGRIDAVNSSLSGRIDAVNSSLSGRIDGLDKRIDDLRNGIYLWLVAIGLVVAWPKAREVFREWGKSAPSITLEDVQRLIEEQIEKNNAKLGKSLQV